MRPLKTEEENIKFKLNIYNLYILKIQCDDFFTKIHLRNLNDIMTDDINDTNTMGKLNIPQLGKKFSLTSYFFSAPYPLKTVFSSICAHASKNSLHFLYENATFFHLGRFRAGKVMPKLWLLESTFLTSCCDSNQGLHTRPVWRGPEGKSPKIQIQLKPKFYYGN